MLGKLWCRISGIGEHTLFAKTQEGDLVAISRHYKGGGIPDAQVGDIVACVVREHFEPDPTRDKKHNQPIKWHAQHPKIIGKKFELVGTEWKAEQDFDSDEAAFSAAFR